MVTGSNQWPSGWQSIPSVNIQIEDTLVVGIDDADGVRYCAFNRRNRQPLTTVCACSIEEFHTWKSGTDVTCYHFTPSEEAAWFPKGWVEDPQLWMSPLGEGAWERRSIDAGMELIHRPIHTNSTADSLMAHNAERWLRDIKATEVVHVHRLGRRIEICVINSGRIIMHNQYEVQGAQDAAYVCMLAYDQCNLQGQHVRLVWEGDADSKCWEILQQFIQNLDHTNSKSWSAFSTLLP